MKVYIAKIRIVDEGFENAHNGDKLEFVDVNELKENILGHDFETYGVEVTDILSFEEEPNATTNIRTSS